MTHDPTRSLLLTVAAATLLAALLAQPGPARAQFVDHDKVSCPEVPKEEKRPQMELQRKLKSEGWKVRQVKNFNGCYEVYGFDEKGERTEAFFDPRSFTLIGRVKLQ